MILVINNNNVNNIVTNNVYNNNNNNTDDKTMARILIILTVIRLLRDTAKVRINPNFSISQQVSHIALFETLHHEQLLHQAYYTICLSA
jgi:hypothetical protein